MLRSIYHLACTPFPTSKDAYSTFHHNGSLKILRCAGEVLECFCLEVSDIGSMLWKMTPLHLRSKVTTISVHCFNQRVPNGSCPMIGVLVMKAVSSGDDSQDLSKSQFSLRLYGGMCVADERLEHILSDVQVLELDFVPSVLSSIVVPDELCKSKGLLAGAFLVGGSSKELKVVVQNETTRLFTFLGDLSAFVTIPPSLQVFKSQVLCVDIAYFGGGRTGSAFGCDDGSVLLVMNGVEKQRVQLDGPIASVCLFSTHPHGAGRSARQELWADQPPNVNWTPLEQPNSINWGNLTPQASRNQMAVTALSKLRSSVLGTSQDTEVGAPLHLAVGGAIGFALLFQDVAEQGLEAPLVLCEDLDSVLSIASGDFNCDGKEELVFGTYGGAILIFGLAEDGKAWELKSTMDFGPPVCAILELRSIDVVPYVVVGTSCSFDTLAPPLGKMEQLLGERLDALARTSSSTGP